MIPPNQKQKPKEEQPKRKLNRKERRFKAAQDRGKYAHKKKYEEA